MPRFRRILKARVRADIVTYGLTEQLSAFSDFLKANWELIKVASAVGLGIVGVTSAVCYMIEDKRHLEEVALREKEGLDAVIASAQEIASAAARIASAKARTAAAQAATERMERMLQSGSYEEFQNFRRELYEKYSKVP